MRTVELVFGLVVVVGLALVAYGVSQPTHHTGLDVEGPIDESSIGDESRVVAYETLSASHQQSFDRARTGDGEGVDIEGWRADFVRYEGQYYRTTPWSGESGRILFIAAGWGAAAVGAVLFVGSRLLARVRAE